MKNLAVLIDAADLVSFDFFDTLFMRDLLNPEDVFDIIGNKYSIRNFRAFRIEAQIEAFRRMHIAGRHEISLAGIYDCMPDLGIDGKTLMDAELKVEFEVARPNVEMMDAWRYAKKLNKLVAITSDMYLPASYFNMVLNKHGIICQNLLISSELNATKRDTGALYDVLCDIFPFACGKVLHIGDNPVSDVQRAREKGLSAFHYIEIRKPIRYQSSTTEASIASAMIRRYKDLIPLGSFKEFGFIHGGPATVAYLDWLRERFREDRIKHVLFMSRDSYSLHALVNESPMIGFPSNCYFFGSRTAFNMAAINTENFGEYIEFLLSGASGLSPHEIFERIGVNPPSDKVFDDAKIFGLYTSEQRNEWVMFLFSMKNEILQICHRNRRALFNYLHQIGVRDGDRIALVDIGWNGTSQDGFERAVKELFDIEVFGYYFSLTDSFECNDRKMKYSMTAMFSSENFELDMIKKIYPARLLAELLFSAPHGTVIGWGVSPTGDIVSIEDLRGANSDNLSRISASIFEGVQMFAAGMNDFRARVELDISPLALGQLLVDEMIDGMWVHDKKIQSIHGFDAWGYSINRELLIHDY